MNATATRKYGNVVFMQGDDYTEAESVADAATAAKVGKDDAFWPGLYRGTSEWTRTLFDYLMQWEYGEGVEESDKLGAGSSDEVIYYSEGGKRIPREPRNGYALSYNISMGYAGLTRITTES